MFIQTCLVQQPSLGIDYEQSAVSLINLENADVLLIVKAILYIWKKYR